MKRILQKSEACQCVLLLLVMFVATAALMVLLGEENPGHPVTAGELLLMKAGATGVLYLCYRIGKFLYRNGMLPKRVMDETEKTEKEDVL